jgi:hypothetical protein
VSFQCRLVHATAAAASSFEAPATAAIPTNLKNSYLASFKARILWPCEAPLTRAEQIPEKLQQKGANLMKDAAVRIFLATSLLTALALPVFADGSPVPWPKKTSNSVLRVSSNHSRLTQPVLLVDGSPVPWPKKTLSRPALQADGSPVPWPKKSATETPLLIADGSPVPWPKK